MIISPHLFLTIMELKVTEILPHILLDRVYCLYHEVIEPLQFQRELKQCKKRFIHEWSVVNRTYFAQYKDYDEVIDLMDEVEGLLNNDIQILNVSLMNLVNFLPLDQQLIVSTMYNCYILCLTANILYYSIHNHQFEFQIDTVTKRMYRLCNLYFNYIGCTLTVNPNNDKNIVSTINNIVGKLLKWGFDKGTIDCKLKLI